MSPHAHPVTPSVPAEVEVLRLDETTSTMDEARTWAAQNPTKWGVILAHRQTAGRGRIGRVWNSPDGGVWMTLVVPATDRVVAPLAALRAALAAAAVIDDALAEPGVARIRWPNDLLLGRAKVGGVLGETAGPSLLIGLGLNVNNHPADLGPGLRTPATSLAAHAGRPFDLGALIEGLSGRLIRALGTAGPLPSLRADEAHDLNARLADLGRAVEVSGAGAPVAGVLLGVDPDGALRVEVAGGTRRFVSGEVSCRAVETPRAETKTDE